MTQNKSDNWVRFFQVGDPKKHKDGFTIYKVTSVVFPKSAPEAVTNIVVWKRFNDFKKLHTSLKVHHKNCNITEELPKLSRAKYFKRFEGEIIQERIQCTLELLNFIARHPPLFTCVPFLQFFNNSYQVSDTITDYEINTVANDNGNESEPTNALCNINFVEKCHVNGDMKKDPDGRNVIDSDNSYIQSASSEDESVSISEGTETLPLDPNPKGEAPLDNAKYQTDVRKSQMGYDDSDIKKKKVGLDEESHASMAKSLTSLPDHFVGETVTCHSEKPIKDSEMWVCIHSEDFRSKSYCLLPSGLAREGSDPSETGAPCPAEDYLVEAAYLIGQAQKCEIGGEYESAFALYRAVTGCLLSGISEAECKETRMAVQEKIKRYAQRAENVYALHLSKSREEEKEKMSCTEGLKVYKVLSIIDKVLLVLNTSEDKRYVIKVLEKSPCPVDLKKKTIIPYNVPYMVKLVRYFENENSIFLVLQYAAGGKLWDYVERCFESYRDSLYVSNGNEPEFIEYTPVEVNGVAESAAEERSEKSYFEILKDYTTFTAKRVFGYYECDSVERDVTEPVIDEEEPVVTYETASVLVEEELPEQTGKGAGEESSEITDLVKNSQKLLESIRQTLQQSDYVTGNLTKDLSEIETALDLEKDLPDTGKTDDKGVIDCKSKKRSKSVARSRFERSLSSEDVRDSRSRTASNSLDRSGQWSRLAAMLESSPTFSESTIRKWAAEMFVALETLHRWGVTCRDLHPGNILLDENGHLLLTFQLYWRGVDTSISEEAVAGLYAAPETTKIFPVTSAADWWSYGALLFYLLTGKSLSSCYPGGIFSHTIITFPEFLSQEACSLLTELLRYEPSERLGGGVNGSDDIKCHPFFNSIDWQVVYEN